jgi:hypothetical protein
MQFEPEKITKEHVLQAAKVMDSEEYKINPSTGYDVIINAKKYPPKDIMRFAHELATGNFFWYPGGGEPTNKYLKALGFEIKQKSVSLENIIDAFIFYKPELKMMEIKDYVFNKRDNSFEGYKSRYSFDQTIQKIVETHCPTKSGYKGKAIFESFATGHYRLSDHNFWADISKDESVDNQILKINSNNTVEDFELVTRTLREVSMINRNKDLVQKLKSLYDNTCQICRTKLKIAENIFYSEVHHIQSLGEPHNGPDTSANMIVVCPNCHVLLDFKAIEIVKDKIVFKRPHEVDDIYIEYHNKFIP